MKTQGHWKIKGHQQDRGGGGGGSVKNMHSSDSFQNYLEVQADQCSSIVSYKQEQCLTLNDSLRATTRLSPHCWPAFPKYQ